MDQIVEEATPEQHADETEIEALPSWQIA